MKRAPTRALRLQTSLDRFLPYVRSASSSPSMVEYAKVREQFGRVIGGFQAIKHRAADMAVRAEMAGAQVARAALAEAECLEDAGLQLWSPALSALQAARENSAARSQIHGGMTWGCHAHRYMKRAQLINQLLGGARVVEARLLQQPAAAL